MDYFIDKDPEETQEWIDAFEGVLREEGSEKAQYIIRRLIEESRKKGIRFTDVLNTPYENTLPAEMDRPLPGSFIARSVAAYVRWNAMAMVVRANRENPSLGGHIASFASSSAIYEVGFDYFFRGPDAPYGKDLIFFQGHSAPGMYARAFVEGVLTEDHLKNFRREVGGKGLSSYPHPWLMPEFWSFPTVSMGLGPLMAIYQARFMKYLEHRKFLEIGDRKIWAFLGDGETDEPESLGALSIAAREHLDNLIFVVNCNLQRLDGPVRGNGKVIQELESIFKGAGWNVIKVLWSSEWDVLFKKDKNGILSKILEEIKDGDFQRFNTKYKDGAFVRETLFGKDPELLKLVEDMSDKDLSKLSRGGHDPRKIYTAFQQAMEHQGQPTVILAQTVKGHGMAGAGEAANTSHSQKKMAGSSLLHFRDRFNVPLSDEEAEKLPFILPPAGSQEEKFIRDHRKKLGGFPLTREPKGEQLKVPPLKNFASFLEGDPERKISTTMAFVRLITGLLRDPEIGKNVVPIIADEARTFGMEGLFRQFGIYAPTGQLYTPVDKESVMYYKESKSGQLLQEGINEAGAFASWLAAGTSYTNHNIPMIPFYTYYSMFGFQRIGDLAWVAGDIRARGFLMGGTAGRTTLNGEGLQHQDGQSLLQASLIPTCMAYDPTFSYELAVILQDGLRRMYHEREDLFYYVTLMNENYTHRSMPKGAEAGIRKGLYLLQEAKLKKGKTVQLGGSGSILNEVLAAAELLEKDFDIRARVWSLPGINQLHRDGIETERWNRDNPGKPKKVSYVTQCLADQPKAPFIVSTDYMRAYPEQIRRLVPGPYHVLGTDGFGRSDTRENLRSFFENDRYYITLTALQALAEQGDVSPDVVKKALKKYKINTKKKNPLES